MKPVTFSRTVRLATPRLLATPTLPERRRRDVTATLRDLAFVLKLTEQVKEEILADRELDSDR